MIAALIAVALQSAASPSLDAFAQFTGSCWTADFTPTMRDTHCFELMYDGAHVRDRHEVREGGRAVYAGETIYSIEGSDLVFTYFNSLGGIGHGTVTQSEAALRFKGSMRASPDKEPQAIDSEWRIVDEDHYEVRSLVPSQSTAGNPVLRFTRVPQPSQH